MNYLRPAQVEECERERSVHQAIIARPDPEGKLNKGQSREAIRRIDKMLEQAPPELNGEQRTKASKLVKKLEEEMKEGMLSAEEMRRNPPGAVAQNRSWEKRNKRRIRDWKNAQLALNRGIPSDEAGDLCNIDRLRPQASHLSMEGAQIPARRTFSFPSQQYKSNWDEIFAQPDPEKEAMREKLAALESKLEAAVK